MTASMEIADRNFRTYETDGYFGKEEVKAYAETMDGMSRQARASLANRIWNFFQEAVQVERVPLTVQCFYCGTVDNTFPCPHAIGGRHSIEYVGRESAAGILPRLEPVNLMGINRDNAREAAGFIRYLQQ